MYAISVALPSVMFRKTIFSWIVGWKA